MSEIYGNHSSLKETMYIALMSSVSQIHDSVFFNSAVAGMKIAGHFISNNFLKRSHFNKVLFYHNWIVNGIVKYYNLCILYITVPFPCTTS